MRILLALHDAASSEKMAHALIAQMKTLETEIIVLHVLEEFPEALAERMGCSPAFPDFTRASIQLRKEAKEFLQRTSDTLRNSGFEASSLLEEGDAKEVILLEAKQCHADLILVGSHGKKGFRRFLMGGTSEAVARHAECSVQIVRWHDA